MRNPNIKGFFGRELSDLQAEVVRWMLHCFGLEITYDPVERNARFLEEALELVQSCDMTREHAHRLVDYVYGRPVGEQSQEVGGTLVTLAALCHAHGISAEHAFETEVARIWTKVDQIRAKQAQKPNLEAAPEASK